MNITSFNPLILSKDAKEIVALFEEMGFERHHNKKGEDFSSNRMKHEGGFHVDVTEVATPQDITSIRMNVSDFDEAYDMLVARGFKSTEGAEGRDTGTSRSTMMISPTGFSITIVKHIKK